MSKLIRGFIFDMDGTLCLPQKYMFQQMRDALQIDKSVDILDYVHSLPPSQEQEAKSKLERIERAAMLDMKAQPGLLDLMQWLQDRKFPLAICTRNFNIPVNHLLTQFLGDFTFDPIITRDFKPPKPAPDGILKIVQQWGLQPDEVVMVGDSMDDMAAGRSAGVTTILLRNKDNAELEQAKETDHAVDRLDEIVEWVKKRNGV